MAAISHLHRRVIVEASTPRINISSLNSKKNLFGFSKSRSNSNLQTHRHNTHVTKLEKYAPSAQKYALASVEAPIQAIGIIRAINPQYQKTLISRVFI
ncbi:hypothetical protein [Pararobbsia alpina]|uniref:hypothetical protein n=1 Tax=Pararobbsia alpina TaxID=621374 RepID=UPI0039A50465